MSDNYLTEAFSQLRLQEQDFDMTSADIGRKDELKAFVADDIDEPVEEEIIDVDAENDDDLQDSYIGKVITECNCCHSRYYEEKEDVIITEDGLANVDKECPVCHQSCGYTIIGEIQPYDANEYDVEITKKIKIDGDEELEEAYSGRGDTATRFKKARSKFMGEDLKDEEPIKGGIAARLKKAASKWRGGSSRFGESIQDATIETDEDIIKLSAKKKEGYDEDEMIAPIDNLDDFNLDDYTDDGENFIEDEGQEDELPDAEGADFDIDATEDEEVQKESEDDENGDFKESLKRRRRTNEDYA